MILQRYLSAILCVFSLSIILFISLPQTVAAQQDGRLRVIVTAGDNGTTIPGANIVLLEPGTEEFLHGQATDKIGLAQFDNLSVQKYRIRISYTGYRTLNGVVTTIAGKTKILRVTLNPKVSGLGELIVEDRRRVTTGDAGLERVSQEDISRVPSPVAGGDLASYLQGEPSVITKGDRGGELFIQGGKPSQNKVLVDGFPIIKPFHISNLFSAFPAETIQNVDFYAGGFGAEYTGATSGLIDVKLRPGNFKKFNSRASVSSYATSLQLEGPIKKDQNSFMLMARTSLINQTESFLPGDNIPTNFYDITARYSFKNENNNCNITGIRTSDRGQIDPERDIDLSWTNTVMGLQCIGYSESLNHPIDFRIGYTGYSSDESSTTDTPRETSLSQILLGFDHKQTIGNTPFSYGLETTFRFYNTTIAQQFTTLQSLDRVIRSSIQVYFATVLTPNKYLTIEPSFGSLANLTTAPTYEPRLRVAYRPNASDDEVISLALGRYTQVTTGISNELDGGRSFTVLLPYDEEFLPSRDIDFDIPSALHGILSYKKRFGSSFTAKAESYIKKYNNIPVSSFTPTARLELQTTAANGLAYGLDLFGEYSTNSFYASLGYGYAEVEYTAAFDNLGRVFGDFINEYNPGHDQRHKLNMAAGYKFGGFSTNLRWEFGSGRPYTRVFGFDLALDIPDDLPIATPGTARTFFNQPFDGRLPGYHRLDFSVERSFALSSGISLDLKAGAINTYDRKNIFYFDSNNLQRVDQTPFLPYVSLRTQFN